MGHFIQAEWKYGPVERYVMSREDAERVMNQSAYSSARDAAAQIVSLMDELSTLQKTITEWRIGMSTTYSEIEDEFTYLVGSDPSAMRQASAGRLRSKIAQLIEREVSLAVIAEREKMRVGEILFLISHTD